MSLETRLESTCPQDMSSDSIKHMVQKKERDLRKYVRPLHDFDCASSFKREAET